MIPAHNMKSAFVFRFTNGITSILNHVDLPTQIQDRLGESLAATYVPLVCH